VLFCIWEARVQDFEAFVNATRHDATAGMYSDRGDGYKQQGDTWKSPGFPQGATHPVVGVNETDAKAFCAWLTEKERREGRLGGHQSYRLPTDAEWDAAVGKEEFPWGSQWPPPKGAGNYADEAAKRGRYKTWSIISGYDDGYDATAPVGSFTANRLGIYDLGGNVWERVGDRSGGVRGASFLVSVRGLLASSIRYAIDDRYNLIGFRLVCAVGSAP
jgi:formylglycine-generating enzyme required for sulfatase activity